ncbi:MAG: DUF6458 family protein [Acidimicrobiales bacterium]
MRKETSGGIMALGIVLAAVGAILRYAITATNKGFNIHEIGIILLIVGIVVFLISIAMLVSGSHSRSTVREDVRNVPGGTSRTVERDDQLP